MDIQNLGEENGYTLFYITEFLIDSKDLGDEGCDLAFVVRIKVYIFQ